MKFEEKHLVHRFGELIDTWPVAAMSPGASHMVIIGNEVSTPGAGDGGGAGSIDLLAIDDQGELWVIEAKLKDNAQSDPAYVFGNQLMRYASHLKDNGPDVVHKGLEGYVFGRRAFLKPPPALEERWRDVKNLKEMLVEWGRVLGVTNTTKFGEKLSRRVGQRILDGNFVSAALIDQACDEHQDWILDIYEPNDIQGALLTIKNDAIEIVYRSPPQVLHPRDVAQWDPKRFKKIPQSFSPRPSTFAMMLNDTAFDLWSQIVMPHLIEEFQEKNAMHPNKDVCSSASFGYCVGMKNGLPLFLRFGRGDKYIATDGIEIPGQHTLKMDINFVWAVAQIRKSDEVELVANLQEDLWGIVCSLITKCGYRIKGLRGIGFRQIPPKEAFFKKITVSDELILEREAEDGKKDFGNAPETYQEDALILNHALEILIECLEGARPRKLLSRPKRPLRTNKICG